MITFNDTYFSAIEEANKYEYSRFIFEYENKYYLVEWTKNKWSPAIEVENLSKPLPGNKTTLNK